MSTLAPVGSPQALERALSDLDATRQALERVAQQVEAQIEDCEGHATDALAERTAEAASSLRTAAERYASSGAALRDYLVRLRDFHHTVDLLKSDYDEHLLALASAQDAQADARGQLREASLRPDEPWAVTYWQGELAEAKARVSHAQQALDQISQSYESALRELEDRAQAAARVVRDCFDAARSIAIAWIAGVVDAVAALAQSAAAWIEEVLSHVIAAIVDALIYLALAIVIVVVVVLVIAMLAVLLPILIDVALVILAAALVFTLAVLMRHYIRRGIDAALDAIGIDGRDRLNALLMYLTVVAPKVAAAIRMRVFLEATKPTPPVTKVREGELGDKADEALAEITQAPDDLADLLEWAGYVDAAGKKNNTVIDVARVVGADGAVSWIVTVPSTQDWVLPFGDSPALNDLDADLILMLLPEVKGAYERAVLEAMSQAGIGKNEPVMMVGWSLGGILSAKMASQGAGGYNYQGVLAAGSPIDQFDLTVPTVQIKHVNDPVHQSDMIETSKQDATHVELWDGPLSGGARAPVQTDNLVGHSNEAYVETARAHLRADADSSLERMFSAVIDFNADAELVSITHEQYVVHE